MVFFVSLLIVSVFGAVYNNPAPAFSSTEEFQHNGSFAGIIDAFTDGNLAGRTFLNFFGSQNKSCSTANRFGYGNATCSLFCIISGLQNGGYCASDGFCTCLA